MQTEQENSKKDCPVCGVDLSTVETGIYGYNNILREMCIPCLTRLKSEMTRKIVIGIVVGGILGMFIFFLI